MAKKKKKEQEGNLGASIALGLVTAIFGLLLGIFSLSVKPVAEVREMPDEESIKPQTVYFVLGNDRGGDYKRKEAAFLNETPGQIVLTEADLNRWASDTFKFTKPKANEEESGGMIKMTPSSPNFRIVDSVMQVGLNLEVEAFDQNYKMRFFTQGVFTPGPEGYTLTPALSYLGSARLPEVGITPYISNTLMQVFKDTERYPELHNAWLGLSSVTLEGDRLILIRQ